MIIVSMFDGCGMARQALKNLGIHVEKYYAFEIDKYAISIAKTNHPDIIHMGDCNISLEDKFFKNLYSPKTRSFGIDLIIGGPPCQDLSIAKNNRKGLLGGKSKLFYTYLAFVKTLQPRFFVMENVASMSMANKDTISAALGVEPVMINSALLTAQNRKRLYWTNIPGIEQPEDKGILLKDILLDGSVLRLKSYCLPATYYMENTKSLVKRKKRGLMVRIGNIGSNGEAHRVSSINGKSRQISANGGGQGAKTGLYLDKTMVRKFHPIECERLQGLPDNYTEGVSNSQRYKMIGNGFTVPVIEHILKDLKEGEK